MMSWTVLTKFPGKREPMQKFADDTDPMGLIVALWSDGDAYAIPGLFKQAGQGEDKPEPAKVKDKGKGKSTASEAKEEAAPKARATAAQKGARAKAGEQIKATAKAKAKGKAKVMAKKKTAADDEQPDKSWRPLQLWALNRPEEVSRADRLEQWKALTPEFKTRYSAQTYEYRRTHTLPEDPSELPEP